MSVSPANTAIPCDKSLLSRYLEAALEADEQLALESHLNGCHSCRATIEAMAADADFWTAATEALDVPKATLPERPLSNLSLSALASLPSGLDTFASDLLSGETPTKSTLSQTQMLQRWLDPTIREDSIGRIGKYEVFGVVGQGGMGLVLKAFDTELERMVAIKTLPHHVTSRTDAKLRLAREARAAAAMRHPNIVSVYGLETWRDVPLIVMPLVEGGTLQQHASKQPLTTEQVLSTAVQIAGALAALHAEGIVHRDLKPSNILLQDGLEHVLLSDFGLARFDGDLAITHSDALAGTPFFMSPEQALGRTLDARSDLFSFGSVLYWLCTHQYPFRGSSNYETLSKLVHSEPNDNELDRLQVPDYLQRLIHRLLAKDPADRWASAEEVVELLQKCLAHFRSSTEPLPWELIDRPAKQSILSRPRLLAATILGFIGFGIAFQQYSKPNTQELERGTTTQVNHADPPEASTNQSLRYGALDELDRRAMLADLERGEKIHYWLRRLAYLPVEDIPPESIPAVQLLSEHSDLATRELSQVVLNKNPFQEVIVLPTTITNQSAMDNSSSENPFQEVLPNE